MNQYRSSNYKAALIAFVIAGASFASAQAPSVEAKLSLPSTKVIAGKSLTARLSIKFAPGFHGYQNPPSEDFEIPLKVTGGKGSFVFVSVKYPAGEDMAVAGATKPSKVYADTITIPITVKAPKKPGSATLEVVVSYQQCDANSCFPPDTLTVSTKATVVASKAAPKSKKSAR